MPWLQVFGEDRRWQDGCNHSWQEATETERRAFIYFDMYESTRRLGGPVAEREKYWATYLEYRRRALAEWEK